MELDSVDVLVVGGGPAGLSAALTLGRVRRRVLVASDGPPRNATSPAAHNVFTRDGTAPAELLRIGRDQLAPYDVHVREERVVDARRADDGRFAATFAGGDTVSVRGIVLATGVRDLLPDVPGLAEAWGTGVFHCPYCHGWEVAGRPLGVMGAGDHALHLVRLVRGLSDDVVWFTGGAEVDAGVAESLERSGIRIRPEPVASVQASDEGLRSVTLARGADGHEVVSRGGLFVVAPQELASDLGERLGCPVTESGRLEADPTGRTPVAGVFVAGDAAPGMQSIPFAMMGGSVAGAMLNHDLIVEDVPV